MTAPTPPPPTAAPPAPAVRCAVCGWLARSSEPECRSCGAPAGIQPPPPPRAQPSPRKARPPSRPVIQNREPWYSPWLALLLSPTARWTLAGLGILLAFKGAGEKTHPPGILADAEPMQGDVPPEKTTWNRDGIAYRPLATYIIKARVIHAERYRFDPMSDIAPVDIGAAWGPMSDQEKVDQCYFSNASRYLNWTISDASGDWGSMSKYMTNMHMIPANSTVRDTLLDLRKGSIFTASGYLVSVTRDGMTPWTSSLSRTDTGNGACEIMWVESLIISSR